MCQTEGANLAAWSDGRRRYRILVVDDDPVQCLLSAQLLANEGFEVDMAEDGEVGWGALQTKTYDLLITDNNMPKVSGMELLRMLRSIDGDMPVIMVSGAMPTEQLQREPQLWLAARLSKPFTPLELLRTVKEVLQTQDLRQRAEAAPPPHAVAA